MSWLNAETQRASLNRVVVTARVITFAIDCLLLKVSVSSFSGGYLFRLGRTFLEGKSCPRPVLFLPVPNDDYELRKRKILCSYFLRGLVAVIFNLHNFMLRAKQNITYQNK